MTVRLFACPSCARHVRHDEGRCPFCNDALPDDFGARPAPVAPIHRMSRAELYHYGRSGVAVLATATLATAAIVEACDFGASSAYGAAPDAGASPGFTLAVPDGGVAVPGACNAGDYVELPSVYGCSEQRSVCDHVLAGCCFSVPDGSVCDCVTFALCLNGTYSQCSCIPPPDGSVRELLDGGTAD
jgi:hypothetical protein